MLATERIKAALMVLPDRSARDIDPDWFVEGENIRVADAFVVGVMLNACGRLANHELDDRRSAKAPPVPPPRPRRSA